MFSDFRHTFIKKHRSIAVFVNSCSGGHKLHIWKELLDEVDRSKTFEILPFPAQTIFQFHQHRWSCAVRSLSVATKLLVY